MFQDEAEAEREKKKKKIQKLKKESINLLAKEKLILDWIWKICEYYFLLFSLFFWFLFDLIGIRMEIDASFLMI